MTAPPTGADLERQLALREDRIADLEDDLTSAREEAFDIAPDIRPRELWRALQPRLGRWTKADYRELAELVKAEG